MMPDSRLIQFDIAWKKELIEVATLTHIHVLDMAQPFASHFRENREKFEYPADGTGMSWGMTLLPRQF